jgi:hypothetical protein
MEAGSVAFVFRGGRLIGVPPGDLNKVNKKRLNGDKPIIGK